MKFFQQLTDGFAGLRFRDRIIATVAVAVTLALGGNLLLIKPQLLEIEKHRASEKSSQSELAKLTKLVAEIREQDEKGIDPFASERAKLEVLRSAIRETESFLNQSNSSSTQVGVLVRNLIRANPGLALVSLKTKPSEVFYTPPAPPPTPKEGATEDFKKVLDRFKKDEPKVQRVVLINKNIYKQGIEVIVRGAYPALTAYLEEMQRFPQRIYWSEATLNANDYQEATLKLLVYTLSEHQNPPLD